MKTIFQNNSLIPTRAEEILALNLEPEKMYKVLLRGRFGRTTAVVCVGLKATVSSGQGWAPPSGTWVLSCTKLLGYYVQQGSDIKFAISDFSIFVWGNALVSEIDTIKEL